jgi:hypothetical protein
MGIRPSITFPLPSLKFPTAGFPQYGFKPDVGGHLRPCGLIGTPKFFRSSLTIAPKGNRRSVSASRRGPSGHSGPEALGSASGCSVPSRHRLLWPHPSFWPVPDGLFVSPAGLCLSAAGQKVPALSCESFSSCHFQYPGGPGGLKTIVPPPVLAFARMRGARRPHRSHLNRYTWAALSRLQNSLHAAARRVACPSPTRTFTFELSFHESPHQNVEYVYAGKSSISRGRTFTGWTRSLTGCTAFRAALRAGPQVVATVQARAVVLPPPSPLSPPHGKARKPRCCEHYQPCSFSAVAVAVRRVQEDSRPHSRQRGRRGPVAAGVARRSALGHDPLSTPFALDTPIHYTYNYHL